MQAPDPPQQARVNTARVNLHCQLREGAELRHGAHVPQLGAAVQREQSQLAQAREPRHAGELRAEADGQLLQPAWEPGHAGQMLAVGDRQHLQADQDGQRAQALDQDEMELQALQAQEGRQRAGEGQPRLAEDEALDASGPQQQPLRVVERQARGGPREHELSPGGVHRVARVPAHQAHAGSHTGGQELEDGGDQLRREQEEEPGRPDLRHRLLWLLRLQ